MQNAKINVSLIEEQIKIAKGKKDYPKVIDLHLEAAQKYMELNEPKNILFHCANYYSTKGDSYFFNGEFAKAKKFCKKAENKFIDINLINPAFHCSHRYLDSIHLQAKKEGNIKIKYYQEFIEQAEVFFERYKIFSENFYYMKLKIIYNHQKSYNYRMNGKLELAEIWSKKSYELAEKAYIKFENERFKNDYIYNRQRYWEFKARRLEKEHKYNEASEYYHKAAVIISATDKLESFNQCVRYHRCLALANKYDHDIFIDEIDKAIEYSVKRNDENQINYLKGFKYEYLVRFTRNIEEKIDLLTKSKNYYFKSGKIHYGKSNEYKLLYYRSKKELKDGNYEKSIGLLEKAISFADAVYFPNVVSSKSILENELLLHQFYLLISNGYFIEGSKILKSWLKCRKDIMGTNKYGFYENLCNCCQKLGQYYYKDKDLVEILNLIKSIYDNRLGIILYEIASLTFCYMSLHINNIHSDDVFESIKLEIISKITTEEAANYVKKSLDVQNALEKREWLYRLPPLFAEKFDDCIFLLNDITDGYHHVVFKEFYKLLENYLKIIIEFNGKTLWDDEFEFMLKEKIGIEKDFNSFTFGDYYNSLVILKDNDADFCDGISNDVLELLKYHVEKRNKITHEFEFDDSADILQDTTKIILGLLKSFPTIIFITDSKRKPWYDIEILWNNFPRKISLYSVKDLIVDHKYYLEPMFELIDKRISPELIIQNTEN